VWWPVVHHGLVNWIAGLVWEDAGRQAGHQLLHLGVLACLEDVVLHDDVVPPKLHLFFLRQEAGRQTHAQERARVGCVEEEEVRPGAKHCLADAAAVPHSSTLTMLANRPPTLAARCSTCVGFTRSNSALVDSGDSRSASLPPTNTQRSSGRGSCSLMYCTARPTRPVPPVTRMTFSAAIL
jgi:hypothetical protein